MSNWDNLFSDDSVESTIEKVESTIIENKPKKIEKTKVESTSAKVESTTKKLPADSKKEIPDIKIFDNKALWDILLENRNDVGMEHLIAFLAETTTDKSKKFDKATQHLTRASIAAAIQTIFRIAKKEGYN